MLHSGGLARSMQCCVNTKYSLTLKIDMQEILTAEITNSQSITR